MAIENFELFKSTMFQRNVELELQAVDILEKQLGKTLEIYRRCQLPVTSLDRQKAMEEEILLQETLEKTAKESNSKDEELKMDQHLQQILEEAAKFEEQKEELDKTDDEEEPVASGGVEEVVVPSDFLHVEPEVELGEGGVVDLSGEDEVEEWVLNSLGSNLEALSVDMHQFMPPIVQALVRCI